MPPSGQQEVLDSGPSSGSPGESRRVVGIAAVAGLVGALIAGIAVHQFENSPTKAPSPLDVQVSLGVGAGGPAIVEHGSAIVGLPLLVLNATDRPVTLVAIQVSGPGASITQDPAGWPTADLPTVLPPDQYVHFSIGLGSNCATLIRPMPEITFIVKDSAGSTESLVERIPGLEELWGQTLLPGVCNATKP